MYVYSSNQTTNGARNGAFKKLGGVLKYFAPVIVISIRCKNHKPGGENRKLSVGANFKLRISGTI